MNHYQLMRLIAAKERLGTLQNGIDIPTDLPAKSLSNPSIQPASLPIPTKKVRENKTIIKNCPICNTEFRITPCHSRYKTCRKPECIKAYRVIFMRRSQTYKKCQGKDCCNYLDSFYRQKTYCSRYCCSHASRKGKDG